MEYLRMRVLEQIFKMHNGDPYDVDSNKGTGLLKSEFFNSPCVMLLRCRAGGCWIRPYTGRGGVRVPGGGVPYGRAFNPPVRLCMVVGWVRVGLCLVGLRLVGLCLVLLCLVWMCLVLLRLVLLCQVGLCLGLCLVAAFLAWCRLGWCRLGWCRLGCRRLLAGRRRLACSTLLLSPASCLAILPYSLSFLPRSALAPLCGRLLLPGLRPSRRPRRLWSGRFY